jgi:hypothetical protein
LLIIGISCGQRSLIEVNVVADAPFQGITLRLAAGGASRNFTSVNLSASADTPYKAGLYVPDSASGSLTVVASALDGAGHCIGAGQAMVPGLNAGAVAGPVTVTVSHTSACAGAGLGTGGSGATGTGGSNDTGGTSGGTGGSGGAVVSGTGGNDSVGGTNGGTGGTTDTGGQSGGNIVINGDFSNGEDSWGLPPPIVGTVSHAVTGGAFCVTLGAASSATIGYPSGATSPFTITGGTSYRFSYDASVSGGNIALEAKVGDTRASTNYDAVGSDWPGEPAGTTLQTFTHTFTRATTDASMGVAFNLTGGPGTVCIDNVSLTLN